MDARSIGLALVFTALLLAPPARAHDGKDMLAGLRQQRDAAARAVLEGRLALEGRDSAQWSTDELSAYLFQSAQLVNTSAMLYTLSTGHAPQDLAALAQTQFCPLWPGNPFSGWQPMQVLEVTDAGRPGELFYEVCPPEFYSVADSPRPMSFETGVFGLPGWTVAPGQAQPLPDNSWAVAPERAWLMLGFHSGAATTAPATLE